MDYFISQGTATVKEFNTFEEMIEFHQNMRKIDRHFCKLYDRKQNRYAQGWKVLDHYSEDSRWNNWN